jgi:hypothetical protein
MLIMKIKALAEDSSSLSLLENFSLRVYEVGTTKPWSDRRRFSTAYKDRKTVRKYIRQGVAVPSYKPRATRD